MDKEQEHKRLLEIVQSIAIAAMEAPPEHRTEFIERTVGQMCEIYGQKQGRFPIKPHQISRLLDLTKDMVRLLEQSGNTVGHA